jgi:hypothetical protein
MKSELLNDLLRSHSLHEAEVSGSRRSIDAARFAVRENEIAGEFL